MVSVWLQPESDPGPPDDGAFTWSETVELSPVTMLPSVSSTATLGWVPKAVSPVEVLGLDHEHELRGRAGGGRDRRAGQEQQARDGGSKSYAGYEPTPFPRQAKRRHNALAHPPPPLKTELDPESFRYGASVTTALKARANLYDPPKEGGCQSVRTNAASLGDLSPS